MNPLPKKIIMIVALLGIGFFAHVILVKYGEASVATSVPVREDSLEYRFINPLLFTDNGNVHSPEYKPLEKQVTAYAHSLEKDKGIDSLSLYFRDLNIGHWTGVNEDEKYKPSSMLKVPLLMSYLKLAEKTPGIFLEKRTYTHQYDVRQHYQSKNPLINGTYTIQQLLDAMIIDSDNDAANILFNGNSSGFNELYQTFRLPVPNSESPDFMSAKSYAVIFRILYNSSYLSREMSEKALKLLSLTVFDKGISASLPTEIVVSHKFGENTLEYSDGSIQQRELHDCGIVYYPQHPYLLCVMTRGQDFATMSEVISNLSKMTYTYIDSKK